MLFVVGEGAQKFFGILTERGGKRGNVRRVQRKRTLPQSAGDVLGDTCMLDLGPANVELMEVISDKRGETIRILSILK